jgi:hypothetical protein
MAWKEGILRTTIHSHSHALWIVEHHATSSETKK